MVVAAVDVQHRLRDPAQVDASSPEFDAAVDQAIFLEEPAHELAERRAGLVRAVEDPFLHAHEVLDLPRVLQRVDEVHVLLLQETERHERDEGRIEQFTRDIAGRIHQCVDV